MQKKYQEFDKVYEFDKKEDVERINNDDKKPTLKKYNKSDLIYNSKHSFYKYYDIKEFDKLSLESKDSFLAKFFNDLDKFSKLKILKEKKPKEIRTNVYHTASSELYNQLLGIYFDEYYDWLNAKRKKMDLDPNIILLI